MICKWCRKEIDDNSLVCPYCGKILDSGIQVDELTSGIKTNYEGQDSSLKSDDKNINNGIVQEIKPNENFENNVINNSLNNKSVGSISNDSIQNSVNINSNDQFSQFNNTGNVEKVNIWFAILSFFIPLVGLIIFLVKKKKEPKTAKVSGICALISFIINSILVILIVSAVVSTTNKLFNFAKDTVNQTIDSSFEVIEDNIDKNFNVEDYENNVTNNNVLEENDNATSNSSTDWKSYEVVINGTKIVLSTTYANLNQITGFAMKSSDAKLYLSNNNITFVDLYKNDNSALIIDIINDTGMDALYTDCKVVRVTQTNYQVSKGADLVYFPGNLKVGESITKDKLIELFGTPTDIYEYISEGDETITYKYAENSNYNTHNFFVVKVLNGVIDELALDRSDL